MPAVSRLAPANIMRSRFFFILFFDLIIIEIVVVGIYIEGNLSQIALLSENRANADFFTIGNF